MVPRRWALKRGGALELSVRLLSALLLPAVLVLVRRLVVWVHGQQGSQRDLRIEWDLHALVPVWVRLGCHVSKVTPRAGCSITATTRRRGSDSVSPLAATVLVAVGGHHHGS